MLRIKTSSGSVAIVEVLLILILPDVQFEMFSQNSVIPGTILYFNIGSII